MAAIRLLIYAIFMFIASLSGRTGMFYKSISVSPNLHLG